MSVDEELLVFIRTAIGSVWAVECLVLLRQDGPRAWTAESLARELRSNPRLIAEVLARFETAGLVQRTDAGFHYAPASPALDQLSGRLERDYRERPVSVVNAIVRARSGALQTFADAFRLRGGNHKP